MRSGFDPDNTAALHAIVQQMAQASLGVMISGEAGLGKEEIVRLLYARSPQRGAPFIKVNCPLLTREGTAQPSCPPESTTLALFRLFQQGVLYFHRVDRLDRALQERLLALLKRKLATGRAAGVLLLSTARHPLEQACAEGAFLPPLYELLAGISIHVPPLRRSPERIEALIVDLMGQWDGRRGPANLPPPTPEQLCALKAHLWPGNLNELQALVQRALRVNDWDAAISTLRAEGTVAGDFGRVMLTPQRAALMPDFEITHGAMLEQLGEGLPPQEMGLMDLVLFEESLANKKG